MSLKKPLPGLQPFLVFGLGASFYLFQFILRVSPNVLEPDILHDLKADAYNFSLLSAYYYVSYSLLQIPIGMLVDHFGPRRIVTLSIGLCIFGALIFSQAQTMGMAQGARFLMGAGSACAFISCLKLGSVWFTPKHYAKIVGFSMLFGTVGATGGGAPLALLADGQGWRTAILWISLLGIALMGLYWIIVRDHPPHTRETHPDMAQEVRAFWKNLTTVVKDTQNWLISLYGLLCYTPITILGDAWGVPFLMSVYGIDRAQAAAAQSMMFVGVAIGAPLMAYASDRFGSRKKIALAGILGTLLGVALILYAVPHMPFSWTFGVFLITGLFLGGQTLAFTFIGERNRRSMGATASGFCNGVVMSAAFALHPLIGALLRVLVKEGTQEIYEVRDFQWALSLMVVGLVAALVVWRHLNETLVMEKNKRL